MEESFDYLTGIWDRDTVLRYLERKIKDKKTFLIAICDIDFFINIDSKVGSTEGDQILKRIATFFSAYNEFIPGRYCSDSFILVFDHFDCEKVVSFANSLKKQFKKQRFIDQESVYAKVPITMSVGISSYSENKSLKQVLKESEIALAEAKKKGRNRVSCYNNGKIHLITDENADVFTLIGGSAGYDGDGKNIEAARIAEPYGLDITSNGDLIIADRGNHAIRHIDCNGIISTIAGSGRYGYAGDGNYAKKALLNKPSGVAAGDGCIYIADTGNHCIRKIDRHGVITTLAGCGIAGYAGDGKHCKYSKFNRPGGVVVDQYNNVYTNDYGNNVIRVVKNNGLVYTIAGSGEFGYSGDGSDPLKASFDRPYGLAVTKDGQYIFVADYGNHCIRKIDVMKKEISTVCGTGKPGYSGDNGNASAASLNGPFWVCLWKDRNLLIADAENNCIRLLNLKTNIIHTITGNGTKGYADSFKHDGSAKYNIPAGMAVDHERKRLYIADYANNAIRICKLI